jgi:hypothetical protein
MAVFICAPGVSDLNITHARNRSPIEHFLEFLNEQKIQSGYCPCNGRFPTARFSFRVWGRGPKLGSWGIPKFFVFTPILIEPLLTFIVIYAIIVVEKSDCRGLKIPSDFWEKGGSL